MKTLKIAVGTTSEQKIGYLKEVLSEIGIKAEVIPVDVKSEVSDQPITEEETRSGSINRAKAAFKNTPEADFGIGIEVGYHKNKNDDYEMFCCASIVDRSDSAESCFSSKFLLPDFHQKVLKGDKYLGEFVREYKKEINEPVISYIRELVRGRKPLIIEATRNALLNYLETKATVSHLLESGSLDFRQKSLAIVVDESDNFLLVQLQDYGSNDWNFSGGGIEEGETPEQAVIRELREELGTDKFDILGKSKETIDYEWPDFIVAKRLKKTGSTYKGQSMTTFLVRFTGERSDIKPDPVEIKKTKWVSYNELKDYLTFPRQWEEIENVLKELKY